MKLKVKLPARSEDCEHVSPDQAHCQPAYRNSYRHCGVSWLDVYSCAVDDDCPVCGKSISPYQSIAVAPCACQYVGM